LMLDSVKSIRPIFGVTNTNLSKYSISSKTFTFETDLRD
jgi:hypothetical protein